MFFKQFLLFYIPLGDLMEAISNQILETREGFTKPA